MNNKISIDGLNNHLFEAIEMLKNNSDPKASENEKMSIETAKAIADLGKVAVDGFKTQAQVIHTIANAQNPQLLEKLGNSSGVLSIEIE